MMNDVVYSQKHIPRRRTKYDVELYLIDRERMWKNLLTKKLSKYKGLKYDIKMVVQLQKLKDKTVVHSQPCFRSPSRIILSPSSITESLTKTRESILNAFDCYMKDGSGWTLGRVIFSETNVYKFSLGRAKGIGGGRPPKHSKLLLPLRFRRNKHCFLSILTTDDKCFLYCVLAALFPPERGSKFKRNARDYLKYVKELDTSMLTYPTPTNVIPYFEEKNNLTINVVGFNKKEELVFLHKSDNSNDPERTINLFLFNQHYHLIRSWTALLNFSKKHKREFCQACCTFNLKRKEGGCSHCSSKRNEMIPVSNVSFPPKGAVEKFRNFHKTCPHPFILYCDIETSVVDRENDDDKKRKIKRIKAHSPVAIGYIRICHSNPEYSQKFPTVHVGTKCISQFYLSLKEEIAFIEDVLSKTHYPISLSWKDEESFKQANHCYMCNTEFTEGKKKVRDHDHLKPRDNYRGAACSSCNLNRSDTKLKIPLFFHNGGKFDTHFLIQELHNLSKTSFNIIAKTSENIMFMEIMDRKIFILDSFNHLPYSLSSLVEQMKAGGKKLEITNISLNRDDRAMELMNRKGVFPYNAVKNLESVEAIEKLPPREEFYDELKESNISQEEYHHAQKVWDYFKCRNLKEYMVLYLKTDITLLADVMENYRQFFQSRFGLDCSHYLSLPGLSYDCMLKHTKNQLDYIYTDEMFNFLKRGMRGGVSMITHRYAEANNPFMKKYNEKLPSSYIIYLDCNALYSSVMTKKLPYKNFRWSNKKSKRWVLERVENYKPTNKTAYFIECDLEYPPGIHDLTKDLPLAPEHVKVKRDMLSPFALNLVKKFNISMDSTPKLLSTQYDKTNYVCHVENLQFYLKMGMKLKAVHKVLKFEQKAILKPYIDLCISERKRSKCADENQMWKLTSNAIFGKTIANLEKRQSSRILTDAQATLKAINSPRFKHADLITQNIVQVSSEKKKNVINFPYYIGVSILELSKLHLMKMHYEKFLPKYGLFKLKLLMTDTDSLLYWVETANIYKDLKSMGVVEFSNYPKENPFFNAENEGELFFLKDETGGKVINNFVGLRAKSYSIRMESGDNEMEKVVGKGVPKHKLQNMNHQDLLDTLRQNIIKEVTTQHLRSFKHHVFTIQQKKVALSPFDNKRYLMEDGVTTLPYGHMEIEAST